MEVINNIKIDNDNDNSNSNNNHDNHFTIVMMIITILFFGPKIVSV